MKHIRFSLAARAATLILACGLYGTASAKVIDDVHAQAWEVVNKFNSMNHGQGVLLTGLDKQGAKTGSGGGLPVFNLFNWSTANNKWDFADLGAYPDDPCTAWPYFTTFNMNPSSGSNVDQVTKGAAKLDYNGLTSSAYTQASGVLPTTLSVGAAYIYTMFITQGKYDGPFGYPIFRNDTLTDAWGLLTLQDRIRLNPSRDFGGVNFWNTTRSNNSILNELLRLNSDKSYWLAPYDPGKVYSEIGYYSVFVMNNTRLDGPMSGQFMTSMVYLAAVPEPETYAMMLAGLGLIGAVARRRRSKAQ